jgi:uracil-DNA glycosylase
LTKLAIVGEAWGEEEERQQLPFVGASGQELTRILSDAGIDRSQCYLTNVFNLRPPGGNNIENLCGSKKDVGKGYPYPMLKQGKYILPQYLSELQRLKKELEDVRPNLILATGNVPTWALLQRTGITAIRGTVSPCVLVAGLKVLPTYHPAAILRQWDLRHVTVLDCIKAKREADYPEIRIPKRRVYVPETPAECRQIVQNLAAAPELSLDIETVAGQISCVGFAPNKDEAYVFPFIDYTRPGNSYWSTLDDELHAWACVRDLCGNDSFKVGQNLLYDMQYLWRVYGITVRRVLHDTMLMHHALQPESPKGLGFLGSVYTNEPAWKVNRPRGKEELKKDD